MVLPGLKPVSINVSPAGLMTSRRISISWPSEVKRADFSEPEATTHLAGVLAVGDEFDWAFWADSEAGNISNRTAVRSENEDLNMAEPPVGE